MSEVFDLADDLGPAKVIHVYNPTIGLKGILVVDNVATGPAIGGLRMAPDVSLSECARLARAMTLKNAAAGLPHGGGKSVLFGDPRIGRQQKEQLIRGFAYALRHETDYVFGPDMGTDETCMAWVKDEIGRSVGLPRELGGIPLDTIGATGWGLLHATKVAAKEAGVDLHGARLVVQGFGAVGKHAARFLANEGTILVAASDTQGTIYDPEGLDVARLIELKESGKSVRDYANAKQLGVDEIIDVECEVWIPAARPDVVTAANVDRLRTQLVVQGANIPFSAEAERVLHDRGVVVVPDFIANAGGVICAAIEYQGASQSAAFAAIEEKVLANTEATFELARARHIMPRDAAFELAANRVKRSTGFRRWGIY